MGTYEENKDEQQIQTSSENTPSKDLPPGEVQDETGDIGPVTET